MKKIELKIKGMHCNSCVALIKDTLGYTKGVKESHVDLKKAKAEVSFDERVVSEKQIIDAIESEGYKVLK